MQLPTFHNPQLLKQALTHRSAVNEKMGGWHNERLEYLGDAVLELVASEFVYQQYPYKQEGELTQMRTAMVRTETLAEIAKELKIPEKLIISRGEKQAGGHLKASLLADTLEAVLGAYYLDRGLAKTKEFIEQVLLKRHRKIVEQGMRLDSKSKFQEVIQAQGNPTPQYRIAKTEGPDHERIFTAQVLVRGKVMGEGAGASKQEAEQEAARQALSVL